MKLAAKKVFVFTAAGMAYAVGQYLTGDWLTNFAFFCYPYIENGRVYCNSAYLDAGLTLTIFAEWLGLVATLLLLADVRGFRRFLKFSLFFVPIALIIIFALFPAPIFPGIDIHRETIARDFGVLYALVTLGIVLADLFRPRRAVSR
jgi:hypothetical protein